MLLTGTPLYIIHVLLTVRLRPAKAIHVNVLAFVCAVKRFPDGADDERRELQCILGPVAEDIPEGARVAERVKTERGLICPLEGEEEPGDENRGDPGRLRVSAGWRVRVRRSATHGSVRTVARLKS